MEYIYLRPGMFLALNIFIEDALQPAKRSLDKLQGILPVPVPVKDTFRSGSRANSGILNLFWVVSSIPIEVTVNQIKGCCYRRCNECEIFKVTQADDDGKRAFMAAEFSELFDQKFKPENINCDGCTVKGGRLFAFAENCTIRKRAMHARIVKSCHLP